MAKRPVDMSDGEYGAYIRGQTKAYALRWKAKQNILNRKLEAAKITVSDAEVEAELKKA